jgi:hypothetical protein
MRLEMHEDLDDTEEFEDFEKENERHQHHQNTQGHYPYKSEHILIRFAIGHIVIKKGG